MIIESEISEPSRNLTEVNNVDNLSSSISDAGTTTSLDKNDNPKYYSFSSDDVDNLSLQNINGETQNQLRRDSTGCRNIDSGSSSRQERSKEMLKTTHDDVEKSLKTTYAAKTKSNITRPVINSDSFNPNLI